MKDKSNKDLVRGSAFQDFTDFSNGSMNGWKVSDSIAEGVKIAFEKDEGHVLDFPEGLGGTGTLVLTKSYAGLASGEYEFVMRARSIGKVNPARISVLARNSEGLEWVIEETNLYQGSQTAWKDYSGKVIVKQQDGTLHIEMNNHNPKQEGNDYRFAKLILRTTADVTDFEGADKVERLNGWVLREDYKTEFLEKPGEGTVLYLHTYENSAGHAGVFLSKTFSSLQRDRTYKFSMRVWLDHLSSPPRLEVKCGGRVVCPETKLSELRKWVDLTGEFTVAEDLATITIENHEESAVGNDFLIAELRVSLAI